MFEYVVCFDASREIEMSRQLCRGSRWGGCDETMGPAPILEVFGRTTVQYINCPGHKKQSNSSIPCSHVYRFKVRTVLPDFECVYQTRVRSTSMSWKVLFYTQHWCQSNVDSVQFHEPFSSSVENVFGKVPNHIRTLQQVSNCKIGIVTRQQMISEFYTCHNSNPKHHQSQRRIKLCRSTLVENNSLLLAIMAPSRQSCLNMLTIGGTSTKDWTAALYADLHVQFPTWGLPLIQDLEFEHACLYCSPKILSLLHNPRSFHTYTQIRSRNMLRDISRKS